MSYAFYRWFPGDYMMDTMHLSVTQDCMYRRLIDLYNITGRPIRNDRAYILRAVRATEPEHQDAADFVLAEFFVLKPDGWHQLRCDAEVRYRRDLSEKGKRAVRAREMKRSNTHKQNGLSIHSKFNDIPSSDDQGIIEPEPEPELEGRVGLSQRSLPIGSEPQVSSAPTPADSTGVWIPLVDKSEWSVPLAFLTELETAYPDVLGVLTLREIRVWCLSNPQKCKTARGVKRFINRWFEKEQNHG